MGVAKFLQVFGCIYLLLQGSYCGKEPLKARNSYAVTAAHAANKSGRGSHWVTSAAARLNTTLLWQGFHWAWQRKVFGFETPHRLGSVASVITNVSASSNWEISGTYTVQFSPGVDGDYAFPKVYYSGLVSKNSSLLSFLSGEWNFSFSDNSTTGLAPHADTTLLINASISMFSTLGSSQAVSVSLQGVAMEMECIENPQYPCNSNAMWTYYLNVSLAAPCTVSTADRKVLICTLLFAIGRGWTPSKGGGKAYNYQMHFNVTVHYSAQVYHTGSSRLYRRRICATVGNE